MNTELTILHLEDDRLDAELIQATLVAQGIVANVVLVQTEEEFRTLLPAKNIDLILADYTLPGFNGTAALRLAQEIRPQLPFIFVSGTVGEEFAIETLKGGATDYVLKQGLQRLGLTISRALNEKNERQRLLEEIQTLRECEERRRLLFDRCPAALWAYDVETLELLAINEAALEQYGYSREEFLELSLRDICRPEDFPALAEPLGRPTKGSTSRSCKHRKKDGTTLDVEVTFQPVSFGGRAAEIVLARAIAPQAVGTQELGERTFNAHQRGKGQARVPQELWQASKHATMSEMASRIATELSEPLATMSTLTERLAARLSDTDSYGCELDDLSQQLDRLGSLASNLLHLSKVNRQPPSRVDLREELSCSLEFMDGPLRLHNIEVVREFAAELSEVDVDPQQIQQVFFNLLANASESMSHGGVLTARIYPGVLENGQGSVVAELADTGTGFNTEELVNIWEPSFFSRIGERTELGLAISRRTIEEYGGNLEISSDRGQGTTVRVMLPAANGHAGTQTSRTTVARA